jgi:hypothetical protein
MSKNRGVHLDSGAVFLRSALYFFIARELFVWQVWLPRRRLLPWIRIHVFLFKNWATPHSVVYALLFAAAVTTLLELAFRLVLAPLVRLWHAPRSDESAGLFYLSASEWVVESCPARRRTGWMWSPGTLIRTNQRLWFFPRSQDGENWSRPLAEIRDARLVPAPRVAWGLIAGWPGRVALGGGDDAIGAERFAVLDPGAVLSWLNPDRAAGRPDTPIRPDARPLPTSWSP